MKWKINHSNHYPFPSLSFYHQAIRKDWHYQLACAPLPSTKETPASSSNCPINWDYSYRHWRGYVQREGKMTTSLPLSSSGSPAAPGEKKPKIFLLHGFGGSIDQFTGLANEVIIFYLNFPPTNRISYVSWLHRPYLNIYITIYYSAAEVIWYLRSRLFGVWP